MRGKDSDRIVGVKVGDGDGLADGSTIVANDVLSERSGAQLLGAVSHLPKTLLKTCVELNQVAVQLVPLGR